ncbi:single-stranded DNA-binding protein [Dorea amylophila]|uniref:single-stranded DNA-binding protein n=1 Tax=Dorea amylophila TaxID=2981789 RepID=UPI0022E00A93|nr:single-stranded DNA-binding protein [Dorea amylophila]
MNVCTFVGRLTSDPNVNTRNLDNGSTLKVVTFTLAVRRSFKNKQTGNYDADFIPCVAFGNSAEYCDKYFHQGLRVCVSGHIQTPDRYTDQDGNVVYPNNQLVLEKQEIAESLAEQQEHQNQAAASNNANYQQNNQPNQNRPQNQSQAAQNRYQQPQNQYQAAQNGYQQSRNQYQAAQNGYQQSQNGTGGRTAQNQPQSPANRPQQRPNQASYAQNNPANSGQQAAGSAPSDNRWNNSASNNDDGFMNIPDGLEEELPFN